jgi:hypothetical protein
MPLIEHPTLMDILRWGSAGATMCAFIFAWQAGRTGRQGYTGEHRRYQQDSSTLSNLGWLLAAVTLILWWLPLN